MTDERNADQTEDQLEDLDVGTEESAEVKGGITARKAGGGQQEYLKVELENVQITSYQLG